MQALHEKYSSIAKNKSRAANTQCEKKWRGAALLKIICAVAVAAGLLIGRANATEIEVFAPQGTVKNVRQVNVRFSAPMVAFGDLRLPDPFSVTCPEQGSGRWLDDKNWSYDFARDLPAGVRCKFTALPGLKDSEGNTLTDKKVYTFSTGGPTILRSLPYAGNEGIDENQIFVLGLDAPANEKSILKNVFCQAEGINEKIGVSIIKGDTRAQLLKQSSGFLGHFGAAYFRQLGLQWPGLGKLTDQQREQLPIVLLRCKRSLFAASKVDLRWGAGVTTASGIASEAEQMLSFRTRPEFTAQFNCDRVSAKAQCIPFLPMSIGFSAPIKLSDARAITLTASDGSVFHPTFNLPDNNQDASNQDADSQGGDNQGKNKTDYVSRVTFKGPFPEQTQFTVALPTNLRDDAQRKLSNRANFPLGVATDEMPPLAKFAARFGIVELNGPALLPVTLRNIEAQVDARMKTIVAKPLAGQSLRLGGDQDKQILDWFYRLQQADNIQWNPAGDDVNIYPGEQSLFKTSLSKKATTGDSHDAEHATAATRHFQLPKPSGAKEFEVVGIPLPKPGFYIVELESPKLGAALLRKQTPMYVSAGALVTNMAAHFKHGAESSLVWLTTLDKAQPIANAAVNVRDCAGELIWSGNTDKSGIARIAQALPKINCEQRGDDYFISARSGDDMTFTLSSWSGGIQPWRFNLPYAQYQRNNVLIHTVFDRTLLMANDTLHMKHFRRVHVAKGLSLEKDATAPDKVVIRHVGSDQTYELPLVWSNGSAVNEWKVPADAKQGNYQVEIGTRSAGEFRVEVFRLPTMKALLQGPKTAAVQASSVDVDIQLNYLAGGGAAHAPVKMRSLLEDKSIALPAYEDYVFSNGAYRERSGEDDNDNETEDSDTVAAIGIARTQNLLLDQAGAARIAIDKLPPIDTPRDLRAELEYRDANGELATASTRIPLWPAHYLIGLKAAAQSMQQDGLQFTALVVDLAGRPVSDAAVSVDFFQRQFFSHRRRLLGGFYAFDNSAHIKPLGNACSGRTDSQGLLSCDVKAPVSGNIILQASTVDAQGNTTMVHQDRWVAGSDEMWFDASDNDRIDVLPQQKNYQPGATATLQVRMPFRSATALITVEREGVLDTYVQPLSGKDPQVHVPIKNSYAPNVYVSVFVVRGRSDVPQPTALVDLGKPAYKMGIAELQVDWRAHELKVAVETDKPVYKVRDKATVKIRARRADGGKLPAGSEVALVVIDEGLLELKPNDSWNLLAAMMQRRPLEVETATAQMQVIGKRHFGRKAVPHGGGGGKNAARELFDAMLFWQPRVKLDANGDATVQVPLNDALTTFRVVAIANAGVDLFGTGATALRSTQDLILVAGLPPLVREGDKLRAGFTVRNTTARDLKVELAATLNALAASGIDASSADKKSTPIKLEPQTIAIGAGQARQISWPVQVPINSEALHWEISATDNNAKINDRLRAQQKVVAAVPVQTLQATLIHLDKPLEIAVQQPQDALPGRGGVQTVLIDKLGGALPGVREYMNLYPYSCFEQRASKAIALRSATAWQALMANAPAYLDRDGLLKYFPLLNEGSDSLTAYVLSIADTAGYSIPDAVRQRMVEGLNNFVQGKIQRQSALPSADLSIRKLAALAALARGEPVRPQLLESIQLEPNRWPTSAVLDWYDLLQRSPELPDRIAALAAAEQILRARLHMQGSTLGFSTEHNDALWWLMVSIDSNANRLLLSMIDNPAWQADMGRLARGVLARQQQGHWNTTVANAWGSLALEKFSQKFEADTVTGRTSLELLVVGSPSEEAPLTTNTSAAGTRTTKPPVTNNIDWSAQPNGGSVLLPWPAALAVLKIENNGNGKPWAMIQSRAALPLSKPLSSGYKITKTLTAIERKVANVWSVGDIYRVHLDLEAQSDMTWVVVDDPIPAGATILGSGLGGDSKILSGAKPSASETQPAFEERSFEALRAYYQFVPKGKWSLEYTVRLNNEGEFGLPSTRVEAMYAPEMFGALPNAGLTVAP